VRKRSSTCRIFESWDVCCPSKSPSLFAASSVPSYLRCDSYKDVEHVLPLSGSSESHCERDFALLSFPIISQTCEYITHAKALIACFLTAIVISCSRLKVCSKQAPSFFRHFNSHSDDNRDQPSRNVKRRRFFVKQFKK
jgi:hypothetical protein